MEDKTDKSQDGSPSTLDNHPGSTSPPVLKDTPISSSSLSSKTTSDQAQSAHELDHSLESVLQRLHLTEPPHLRMFAAVGAIFERASQDEDEIDLGVVGDWRAVLQHADELNRHGLTDPEALTVIKRILDQLWSSGAERDLVNATKILADLCRERELIVDTSERLGAINFG